MNWEKAFWLYLGVTFGIATVTIALTLGTIIESVIGVLR